MDSRPIGIFDSGIGGTTVFKEIRKLLSNENIIYFGDTARVPYGSKTEEEIIRFSLDALKFFIEKDVKLLVLACNTVTAIASDEILSRVNFPVVGVIESGIKTTLSIKGIDSLLLIATEATIRSEEYQRRLRESSPNLKIDVKACPMLVSVVEEGWADTNASKSIIHEYQDKKKSKLDAIILGCTHFPVLREQISEYLDENIIIIDPAEETAKEVKKELSDKNMLNLGNGEQSIQFFVSNNPEKFKFIANKIIDPLEIEVIHLI